MKTLLRFLAVAVPVAALSAAFLLHRGQDPLFFPRLGGPAVSQSLLDSTLRRSEERLSKDPNDMKAVVDRGVVYFQMGPEHYADALNAFNAAWQAGAFDPRVFYYSGILYENLSLFEEAQRQYERFLRHSPGDREIRLRLARLLFRMGKWDDAVARYQELLQENGKDVTSLVNCGLAYGKEVEAAQQAHKKRTDEETAAAQEAAAQGIRYLESAAKLQPDLPAGVHFTLAKLYAQTGDWTKTAASCEFELRKSTSVEAGELLALAYEKSGRADKALEAYNRLFALEPRNFALARKVRALKRSLAKQ